MVKSDSIGQSPRTERVTEARQRLVSWFFSKLSRTSASVLITFLPEEFQGGDWRGGTPSVDFRQFPGDLELIAEGVAETLCTLHPELTDNHAQWYRACACMNYLRNCQQSDGLHVVDFNEFQAVVHLFTEVDADWASSRRAGEKKLIAKARKSWRQQAVFTYSLIEALSRIVYRIPDIELVLDQSEVGDTIPALVSRYGLNQVTEEEDGFA